MVFHDAHTRTTILRLRVGPTAIDRVDARARLERALGGVQWRPTGLGPSAILIVRRLRDPMPGSLDLDRDRTPRTGPWERAVTASLAALARRAARPSRGPVPADAEAVLLNDRSELLACLAADWCDGSAIARWWWRGLLGRAEVATAVASEWTTSPEFVPAAIATLARRGLAVRFAGLLGADVSMRLVDEIVRRFGLAELDARIAPIAAERRSLSREVQSDVSRDSAPTRVGARPAPRPIARRSRAAAGRDVERVRTMLAPEAFAPSLSLERRLLLGVALAVARAPAEARERRMAEALVHALVGEPAGPIDHPDEVVPVAAAEVTNPIRAVPRPAGAATVYDSAAHVEPLVEPDPADEPTGRAGPPPTERVERRARSAPPPEESARPIVAPREREPVDPRTGDRDPRPEPNRSERRRDTEPTLEDIATIELAVDTELGGLFCLVNVALALGLYGDFTMPLAPCVELPIWDLLSLMGQELVGPRIETDPVWPLLARLSGRSAVSRPAERFRPDPDWKIPQRWLDTFPESADRTWIECPAIDDTGDPLARWTRLVAALVRARLALALGLATTDELPRDLLGRAARVEVGPARLDVRFSLDELPVAVRLAGLDRDPGWVPAAGRVIAFHYD